MKLRTAVLCGLVGMLVITKAFGWATVFECVSNNAKKDTLTVTRLDAEMIRTNESGSVPDRYYRVTDASGELIEAMIIGHKSGSNGRIVPVVKGTMNLTITEMGDGMTTASVKVGKVVTTYSCK